MTQQQLLHSNLPRFIFAQAIGKSTGRLHPIPMGYSAEPTPLRFGTAEPLPGPALDGVFGLLDGVDAQPIYGFSVTVDVLRERQLYDVVAFADEGAQRILAPHAVYHRAWTGFGIAHITDVHVARHIDRFRSLLVEAGRAEAVERMYNWNDQFRGFVRYANYLHSVGVLDIVVATGDLYDYIFEDDDNPNSAGNAVFLRQQRG